jgi:DegV family protein with EDD domain
MPSAGVFAKIYEKLTAANEEALSVHISTGLSGTIGAARGGAEMTPGAQVTLFDTLTLSGAERFMVLAAALANKAGWAKEAIVERLAQIRDQNEMIYTLETLTYLAKGGRIGRVQALAGAILGLKPVITVDHKDGKYNTLGKERTVTKALDFIAAQFAEKFGQTSVRVAVMHGQWPDKAQQLSQLLQQRLNVAKLEQLRVSPVLGVHTGPGVVGAAVVPAALFEGF